MGGSSTRQDYTGGTLNAMVALSEWQDYKNRFVPYQNTLISTLNNPATLQQDLNYNNTATNAAFNTAQGAQRRDLARLGAVLTPGQRAAADQAAALAKSQQQVAGINAVRQYQKDSDLALMASGADSARASINS